MRLIKALSVTCLLLLTGSAFAQGSSFWQDTGEGFAKGKMAEGVVLSSVGRIELARASSVLLKDPVVSYVHSLAVDAKGTVYVGTGNEGKVYKLAKGKHELFYDATDPIIFSLACDEGDNLYVGTGPSGRIYKITPKGKASVFFDSDESYIWDMAVAPDGCLYAATGPNGKLFRIEPSGKSAVVHDADDPHIYCLAVSRAGTVYFGTSGSGKVLKLEDGETTVLYDAAQAEIRALTLDGKGRVYFGTADVGKETKPEELAKAAQNIISELLRGTGTVSPQALSPSSVTFRGEKIAAKNALYRIDGQGNVLELFAAQGLMILSAGTLKDDIYFGTGNRGKLFKIAPDLSLSELPELKVIQVLSMASGKDGELILGTAGEAKVVEIAASYSGEGKFISRVQDTGFVSKWGSLSWQADVPGGGELAIRTRSGNTEKPDDTWSDWSGPIIARTGKPITSPSARFIQYQALFKSAAGEVTPSLAEVKIAYLTANQPPRIVELKAGHQELQAKGAASGAGASPGARAKIPPGAIAIRWKATDPNKDKLIYELYFKGEGEKRWKLLEEEIAKAEYVWKTEGVPDGSYYVKLVASDSPVNVPARKLEAIKVSAPVVVDNTPPVVSGISLKRGEGGALTVEADIRDGASIIARASYSVDNEDWVDLLPVDEIFDGLSEQVTFALSELEEGEHTLVIKASDDADNVGAGKTVFTVPLGEAP